MITSLIPDPLNQIHPTNPSGFRIDPIGQNTPYSQVTDHNTPITQNTDQITSIVQATDPQATYPQTTDPQATYPQITNPQVTDPQPTQTKTYGKELVNLTKLYTDEFKYSSENDNFDFKLIIFTDLC